MESPSGYQNLGSFWVGWKIDLSKKGSQTSPEGSVSEHLHFSTIMKSSHIFYALTWSNQHQMHNCIQILHPYILFYFLVEKSWKMPPTVYPPSLPLSGVEAAWLHLQHVMVHLTNTPIHHGPLMTNVCITAHSHRSSRTLHRNLSPTSSTLWSKSIFKDSE